MLNISYRRIGGLRFLKLGRLTLSWCISDYYRPIKRPRRPPTIVYPVPLFGARQDLMVQSDIRCQTADISNQTLDIRGGTTIGA